MRRLVLILVLFALASLVTPAFGASYSIAVQTDRASYVGMAQIKISGTVSPVPGPNTAVIVVVTSPYGAAVDIEDDPVDQATGSFNQTTFAGGSITCGGTPCWVTGTYIVNATWGGYGESATMFTTFTYSPLSAVSTSVSCAPQSFVTESTSLCSATVSGGAGTTRDGETMEFSQTGGTGSVSFPSPATCTLSGNSCSLTVTGGSPGTVTIQASYPGDSVNANSSSSASITVTQARPTTSVSCRPSGVEGFEVGLTSPCTATVSGATGTTSGEVVTFSQAGGVGSVFFPSPPSCTLPTAGEATCQILVMGGSSGSVVIKAAYSGDANNAASSGTTTNTVGLVTTTTVSAPPNSTTTSTSSIPSTTVAPKESTTTSTRSSTTSAVSGSAAYLILAAAAVVLTVSVAAMSRRRKPGGQRNPPAEGPSTPRTT